MLNKYFKFYIVMSLFFSVFFILKILFYDKSHFNSEAGIKTQEWKRVLKIDQEIETVLFPTGRGIRLKLTQERINDFVYININNTKVKVLVAWGKPQVGDCIPFFIKELPNGEFHAEMNVQELRLSTKFNECG